MANTRLVLVLAIVVLMFLSGILFFLNQSKDSRLEKAERLGGVVDGYLTSVDVRCRASPAEFEKLSGCLGNLMEEKSIEQDLEETEFRQFDSQENESGYLILTNDGRRSLNSSDFILLLSREQMDKGCAIEGKIEPGYTCKLFFNKTCERGDVLEVKYGNTRAHLKTC